MLKEIKGNLLDIKDGIIVHQVNCKGVMGAGLAKQIKDKYPVVYKDYKDYINFMKQNNLGDFLLGTINSTSLMNPRITVYNFFAQQNYGVKIQQTNYKAFERCLQALLKRFENSKISPKDVNIYFPLGIGCGLAGGKWEIIHDLIEKYIPTAIIVKL